MSWQYKLRASRPSAGAGGAAACSGHHEATARQHERARDSRWLVPNWEILNLIVAGQQRHRCKHAAVRGGALCDNTPGG